MSVQRSAGELITRADIQKELWPDGRFVEFEHAIFFVMSISDTSVLAVTATRPCDVGLIGYEMAVLVERCAAALTPALVAELQTSLPR